LTRTGISKTSFFTKYRRDPYWTERLDMRIGRGGILHFEDGDGVEELRAVCMGGRAKTKSPRADNLTNGKRSESADSEST